MEQNKPKVETHHHHILPNSVAFAIAAALLFLTIITVWVAHIDLGALNFLIAVAIASLKASLVVLFFMNLKNDRKENAVIFGSSFLFLAIFIVLTGTDLFFRGDVLVKGPLLRAPVAASKLSKPWIATSDLVKHGQELFTQQCVTCHGAEGKGNGPAAGALNPPPRNFTSTQGWKNGRKATMVFKTLKEGLPPSAMASYGTLPVDDRWALTHYVLSLGGAPESDSSADFAKIGIDPSKEGGGQTKEAPTVPVEFAMKRMMQPEMKMNALSPGAETAATHAGHIYAAQCKNCHGPDGQGGIQVKSMGVAPQAFAVTRPLKSDLTADLFRKVVVQGIPGDLMPGAGNLSSSEIGELFQYIKRLRPAK